MLTVELSHTLHWSTTSCLVLGCLKEPSQPKLFDLIPDAHHAQLMQLHTQISEKKTFLWQSDLDHKALLLINCDTEDTFSPLKLVKIMNMIMTQLLQNQIQEAHIYLPRIHAYSADQQLECMVIQAQHAAYQLLSFKTEPKHHALKKITFILEDATQESLATGKAISEGIHLTRTMANLPANVCTPSYLAEQALHLEKRYPTLKTTILDENDLATLKMNTFLAVSQGSIEPPRLVQIQYFGTSPEHQPIVLIGKGITFDSGGLSLKPPSGMEEMKYDMAGAASVLGTLKICAELGLPLNVIGLMACAENMPSGQATKPGDIVTTFSGKTVEIINTDAEGRLVLADVLTYAEQFNPRFVIDIATLTGAMIIALGHEYTGFMTKNEMLAELIETAGKESLDKAWRLPLDEAYDDALDSVLADFANARFDRKAGSITAAAFLSQFAKKFVWAHLDIAGTAWVPGSKNAATGRPVPLLIHLLRNISDAR